MCASDIDPALCDGGGMRATPQHERTGLADIRVGEGSDSIERVEAYLPRDGYSPHRHDTYAIGITLSGVQTFAYRGRQHYCLPGQCHILHPDEPHDGVAAADGGFRYRIAYIDPCLIQGALGGRPLPFVAEPVHTLGPDHERLLAPIWDMGAPVDPLRQVEIGAAVAEVLEALAAPRPRRREPLGLEALLRVRALLSRVPDPRLSLTDLERESGLDRWTLARQFRMAFGTSPTRFRTMRQLDRVRALLREGVSLVNASEDAGFADQCHMSRMFRRAYGCSPGKWVASLSSATH
jgi:AraC-like DNA-binding protein